MNTGYFSALWNLRRYIGRKKIISASRVQIRENTFENLEIRDEKLGNMAGSFLLFFFLSPLITSDS